MRYLTALQRFTLNLSDTVRISVLVPSTLVCVVLYIIAYPSPYSGSPLIIPVALAAWLLRPRGLTITLLSLFVFVALFSTVKGAWSTSSLLIPFCISVFSLLVEGFFIAALRNLLELADNAHEQLAAIFEQQRQLNEIKDQFILNVNHELRTPLTAVYGYLELMLEHAGKLDTQMQTTFLKNAMYSCEELQLLVSNVLDTIRIGNERSHLYVEELSVAELVHGEIEHFDPRNQKDHQIRMSIPEHLFIQANGQYVRQVLRNLLSNAIKYTPIDTPIVVSASLYGSKVQAHHPSPEVCISVRDYGDGIPPESIPLLFGQFVRLERDVSGKVRGTGLGLYVSKQLVEAMGGRIWVESSGVPGEGCNFLFTLPCVTRVKSSHNVGDRSFSVANLESSVQQQPQGSTS